MAKKVIVIGWDGATRKVIERGLDEGWLPSLKSFSNNGRLLDLISTIPFATVPAWTSCFTGVNPGKHGYFDFTELIKGTYKIRFTNGSFRKFPAVWNWISRAGKNAIVAGVPGTYPIEEINGIMVSGFISPLPGKLTPDQVYPEKLYPIVKNWGYGGINETIIRKKKHQKIIDILIDRIKRKEHIILELLRNYDWDLFIAVFNESDTVSHHFWMFWDDHSPRHQQGFKEAIPIVYKHLDNTLGRILKEAEKNDCLVMLVSDHGFQASDTTIIHINNWLAQKGYLKFYSNREPLIKKLGLHLFPYKLQSYLFHKLQKYAEEIESNARFAGIDWERTTAFSEELDYFPSIRVNLKEREPQGTIPEEEYLDFVNHICKELKKWEFIKNAYYREEIYKGPFVEKAPDIILEIAENDSGAVPCCVRSKGGEISRVLSPNQYQGGKEQGMNGHHKREGILCISEKIPYEKANIEDISATVGAVMNVPAPPLDGKPLLGSLLTDKDYPIDNYEEQNLTPYEEWLLIQQMKAIGYWQ